MQMDSPWGHDFVLFCYTAEKISEVGLIYLVSVRDNLQSAISVVILHCLMLLFLLSKHGSIVIGPDATIR